LDPPRLVVIRTLLIPAYSALKCVGQDVYSIHGFQRWLVELWSPKIPPLERWPSIVKVGAVTLRSQKLELTIDRTLHNVWIQVQKCVNVTAVAGKVNTAVLVID